MKRDPFVISNFQHTQKIPISMNLLTLHGINLGTVVVVVDGIKDHKYKKSFSQQKSIKNVVAKPCKFHKKQKKCFLFFTAGTHTQPKELMRISCRKDVSILFSFLFFFFLVRIFDWTKHQNVKQQNLNKISINHLREVFYLSRFSPSRKDTQKKDKQQYGKYLNPTFFWAGHTLNTLKEYPPPLLVHYFPKKKIDTKDSLLKNLINNFYCSVSYLSFDPLTFHPRIIFNFTFSSEKCARHTIYVKRTAAPQNVNERSTHLCCSAPFHIDKSIEG